MLSRVKRDGDIQAIVVHKIDRLARNMEDHVAVRAILRRSGAALVSVLVRWSKNIEDSALGRLVEGIHALMSEFYSANLATEVKKGLLQKAKSVGCITRAPAGYRNVRETVTGRSIAMVLIDEQMAPLVRLVLNLYATGDYSITRITGVLDKRGLWVQHCKKLPTKPLSRSAVASMLQNKFYTGVITYQGVEYEGQHEAIVDPELFRRVSEVLRTRDAAGERVRKHPHYLQKTLFCGERGSRLSYLIAKKKCGYFYCLGQKRNTVCADSYTSADELETAVEELYKTIQLAPEAASKLKTDLEAEIDRRCSSSLKEQRPLDRKLSTLKPEQLKLMQAYYAMRRLSRLKSSKLSRLVCQPRSCSAKNG